MGLHWPKSLDLEEKKNPLLWRQAHQFENLGILHQGLVGHSHLRFQEPTLKSKFECILLQGVPVTIKKSDPDVDPLDLGDEDMEVEYEKIDTLRQILAKSSVAITYQVNMMTCDVEEDKTFWTYRAKDQDQVGGLRRKKHQM